MSVPNATSKVCVVCGEDCSTKPRIKDSKGRYYCKPCHEKAMQRAKAPAQRIHPGPVEDAPISIMDQLIADAPPLLAAEHCPQCGFALPAGGIVCTHCGYNTQTRSKVPVRVRKAPRQATGGFVWPLVIGILSMLFGAGGLLLYGAILLLTIAGALAAGKLGPGLFGPIPLSCLLTALSAWLLRSGWRIVRHDAAGVKSIRYWAMTKVLLYGTCLTALMAIPTRQLDNALAQTGGVHVTAAEVKARILLTMMWFLLWPVAMLVFFFVPRIQSDVDQWE